MNKLFEYCDNLTSKRNAGRRVAFATSSSHTIEVTRYLDLDDFCSYYYKIRLYNCSGTTFQLTVKSKRCYPYE